MTEYAWVAKLGAGGKIRTYHTDPECPKLDLARDVRRWELEQVKKTQRKLCKVCENGGEITHDGEGSGHYESLLRAAGDAEGPGGVRK